MRTLNPAACTACPYDIGDVLITSSAKDPSARWPGTQWTKLQDRFLLASGENHSVGSTGGSETVTLTEAQLPSVFSPLLYLYATPIALNTGNKTGYSLKYSPQPSTLEGESDIGVNFGGSQPHNNMPPYLVRHMWERTA